MSSTRRRSRSLIGLGIILCLVLSSFTISVVANIAQAQPADSPWPMFGQNPQRTGLSPYTGPEIPELKWSFTTRDWVDSSPAIGADGTIYVGSRGNNLYAVTQDSEYDLVVSSIPAGFVLEPGEGEFTYPAGTVVDLEATPVYRFSHWTGDVDTIADINAASTTITMNDNYTITANFGVPVSWAVFLLPVSIAYIATPVMIALAMFFLIKRLIRRRPPPPGKTWKPKAAGILSIASGVITVAVGIVFAIGDIYTWLGAIGALFIMLGIVAIVGGIYALRRRVWGLALAGSICAMIGGIYYSWLGIPAIIFVILGKGEFE